MAGKSLLRMTEWKTKSVCKSLSAGKLFVAKKVCAFELCPVLIQKYTKSFGGKNLALCLRFSPIKSQVYFLFHARCCSNSQIFFPLDNPPCTKKSKRDSLYFDLLPGPFTKRNSFFLIICKRNKREWQYNGNGVFICFYFYLLNTILK